MKSSKILFTAFVIFIASSCSKKTNYPSSSKNPEDNEEKIITDAYGSQSARNYTGSAGVVKNQGISVGLDLYLGKISGVSITGQGASAEIRIRGYSSLSGGIGTSSNDFSSDSMNASASVGEPLFVLNGSPFNGRFADLYSSLNVNDIKNVTVLKDASSTAMYGSRGANGVVVINLKKGETK
jgi:TonB-dependent starch-binding outer membrane protein SusC